jgi:predicted DNA-binding transcriptional regulator YafY
VGSREWHPSQEVRDARGGGILIALNVCLDRALTSWILSFGPLARVVSPERLAREIAAQIEDARAQYTGAPAARASAKRE